MLYTLGDVKAFLETEEGCRCLACDHRRALVSMVDAREARIRELEADRAELLQATGRLEGRIATLESASAREAQLHYGLRRTANILDHKLTEQEAHAEAMRILAMLWKAYDSSQEVLAAARREAAR